LTLQILRRPKATDILDELRAGAKCVRELQEARGGSFTTLDKRIRELLEAGMIREEYWQNDEKTWGSLRNRRMLRITDEGLKAIDVWKDLGLLEEKVLPKNRQKWLVQILSVLGEVRGRTRLMKLLFLLREMLGPRRGNFYRFTPWYYGPFSKEILQDIEELRQCGLLNIDEAPNDDFMEVDRAPQVYRLTPRGNEIAERHLKELSGKAAACLTALRQFNEMPLTELMNHIYAKYPEFTARSRLRMYDLT